MIWAIISLIIFVILFGWWGILWFALLVGIFTLLLLSGKKPIQPIQKNTQNISNQPTTNTNDIKCPMCGSTQLTANKKGFSVGQAVAGGIIGGAIGMNKVKITCLKCGNTFNPGQGQ
jgi:ribosomal protein S27E